jgi:hypothetical protein
MSSIAVVERQQEMPVRLWHMLSDTHCPLYLLHVVLLQTGGQVREAFLSFFESKGHSRLPSSSLVPEDPTVLLTIAGRGDGALAASRRGKGNKLSSSCLVAKPCSSFTPLQAAA